MFVGTNLIVWLKGRPIPHQTSSSIIHKQRGKRAKEDENAKKAEQEEEGDDNEELENLEDDYAYYYGSEDGDDDDSEGHGYLPLFHSAGNFEAGAPPTHGLRLVQEPTRSQKRKTVDFSRIPAYRNSILCNWVEDNKGLKNKPIFCPTTWKFNIFEFSSKMTQILLNICLCFLFLRVYVI